MRYFRVADQRSLEVAPHGLWAPPCRELLLTDDVQAARADPARRSIPELSELLDPISRGEAVEGMESLAPVLVDELTLVLRELPAGAHVVAVRPRAGAHPRRRPRPHVARSSSRRRGPRRPAAARRRSISARPRCAISTTSRPRPRGSGMPWWGITALTVRGRTPPATSSEAPDLPRRHRGGDRPTSSRGRATAGGSRSCSTGTARRSARSSGSPPRRCPARLVAEPTVEPGVVDVTTGRLGGGIVAPELKIAFLTEADLTGQRGSLTKDTSRHAVAAAQRDRPDPAQVRRLRRARAARRRQVRRDGAPHDQRRRARVPDHRVRPVEARPARRPAVRPDRLARPGHQVRRRRVAVAVAPRRRRLGQDEGPRAQGGQGDRGRSSSGSTARGWRPRVTRSRRTRRGSASSRTPSPTSRRPTSSAAIDEVKADMEKEIPMDRVICGDVGYGKTEVAVRAAFKAVQDGKQVAVLVPTTLLAHQHIQTFSERMAQFPVTIKELSRFTPAVRRGRDRAGHRRRLDRHRHRHAPAAAADRPVQGPRPGDRRRGAAFRRRAQGVPQGPAHRGRRADDVGDADPAHARDVADRHPRDDDDPHPAGGTAPDPDLRRRLRPAPDRARPIRRELLRDGQVFYIHNRVESINRAAAKLAEIVPEARIAVAHGQMGEAALEQIMIGFWEKQYDVLVATTIVESGPGHPERQHADRRPGRHVRAVAAAPAARTGRPGARARLRLLHLPARAAADRDGLRPAGDDRAAHRDGRRHGGRDEGPRDPRLGQPARRRAVRAHRRRRVRPLRAAGRRGGRRLPRRGARRRRPRSRSTCRSTPTCRSSTCPASGCASRPTARWPRRRPTRRSTRCAPS